MSLEKPKILSIEVTTFRIKAKAREIGLNLSGGMAETDTLPEKNRVIRSGEAADRHYRFDELTRIGRRPDVAIKID